jgi:hypothetical protein
MKLYQIEVTAKFPTWNEVPGLIEVLAKDSKDAISKARREMRNSGNATRQDGPMRYKVKKDGDE